MFYLAKLSFFGNFFESHNDINYLYAAIVSDNVIKREVLFQQPLKLFMRKSLKAFCSVEVFALHEITIRNETAFKNNS